MAKRKTIHLAECETCGHDVTDPYESGEFGPTTEVKVDDALLAKDIMNLIFRYGTAPGFYGYSADNSEPWPEWMDEVFAIVFEQDQIAGVGDEAQKYLNHDV